MPAEECKSHAGGGYRTLRSEVGGRGSLAARDRALAELAGRQHGVVAWWQLRELGLTMRQVEGRLKRGQLQRMHEGVYAVGHRPLGVEARWRAAVLAFGPGAVLSHRSAGQLWRLVPIGPIEHEVTRAGFVRGRPGLVVHRIGLPPDESTERIGIPVTTPARTVFDLAAISTQRQVERAFHELEVRRLWGSLSLADLVERYPGHRGVRALRDLLESKELEGITRNEFEEAFVALLDSHGLPRPRFNATLSARGRFFEADAIWERQRLIAELDGGGVHRTEGAFHADRRRDRILLSEGWRTTRITWHQLRGEPGEVAADLRQALRRD